MDAQIVLENIGVRLPNRLLFEQVNWTIYEGMRVALAGRNGSGKSTLMRIIAGAQDSSEGKRSVVGGKRLRIGFLDQSVLENMVSEVHRKKETGFSPIKYIEHSLDPSTADEHLDRAWEIKKMLSGLGFSEEWMNRPMGELSGGWILRVFIASVLLNDPQVLLLDEPTNHLDISSIQWLEEFLETEYRGSLILITHDVALQRRTTDSLAVIHGGKFFYRQHQNDYLTFRTSLSDEKRLLQLAIESLQKKIDENMEFVFKFRAKAQTAARAQSKLKAAETLTEEQNELKDRLARVEGYAYNMHFHFRSSGAGSKFPLSTKHLSFHYTEHAPPIIKDVSVDIKRGQRIAIIGDNGAGKTTLLNLLGFRLNASAGSVDIGHGVETGFFGQHQLEELSLDNTVLDNLRVRAIGVGLEELRGWLGAFGFGANTEVEKKAKILSGGEKSRLALLRILVTRVNLLLLDEPTNHLDIETKELLQTAIKEFDGTVILVSHDRDFVKNIAERIFYLSVNHDFIDHIGDLTSFFEKYPQLVRHLEGHAKASAAPSAPKSLETKVAPVNQLSYEDRKKYKNQLNSLEKRSSQAEKEIEKLGQEKEIIQGDISAQDFSSRFSVDEQQMKYAAAAQLEKQLTSKMVEWEKWSSELENLKRLLGRDG